MNREEMQKQLAEGCYDLRYIGIDFEEINTKIEGILELLAVACEESEDLTTGFTEALEAIEEGIEEFEYPKGVIDALNKGVILGKQSMEFNQKLYNVYSDLEEL